MPVVSGPLDALFGAALQKLREGRLSEADALLRQVLQQTPDNIDVLSVAAAVARQMGRSAEAIALLGHALKQKPDFAPLHNSLGVALKSAGDLLAAREAFERAVHLQTNFFDALFNLGLVLHAQGLHHEAAEALRRAIALQPRHAGAYGALGNALVRAGELEAGLSALRQADSLKPGDAKIAHNRGIAFEAMGKDLEALAAFREAVRLGPAQALSWFAIGNIERRLGRSSAALEAFQKAIEIVPNDLDAHAALNETAWEAGDQRRFLASYPYAIGRLPEDAGLRRAFAERLTRVGQFQEAEKQARQALSIEPANALNHDVLGRSFFGARRFDEAAECFLRASQLSPDDVAICGRYVDSLILTDKLEEARDALKLALSRSPLDQENIARMATLLRLLGDEAAYKTLADPNRFVSVIKVQPPEGYQDMAAFHAELSPYLLAKHQAKQHPTDQTVRGGTQTLGALFADPHPLIAQLRERLHQAVSGFVADLPEDDGHPFLNRKRDGLRFQGSWSVLLRRGGFHTNHIHPQGWISSAYYVTLPSETASAADRQGWFKLGETNPDTSPALPAERWIQPQVGHLVLFPSYFWHGTQAFQRGDERLTVAFDVVPS